MQDSVRLPQHNPHTGSTSLTDYFLHPDFFSDSDLLHRARILISTLGAFAGIVTTAILFLLIAPVAPISRLVGIPIDVAVIVAVIHLLFLLKRRGRYAFCATVAVAIPLIAVSLAICVTGGVTHSPVAQLLVIPPLMAYFFGGIRGGNAATAVTASTMVVLAVLQQAGVHFPQTILPEHVGVAQSLVMMVGFAAIGALAFVYEFTSASLRRERDHEHANVVRLAHTDALTGLANRRIFDETLTERIATCGAQQPPRRFALCYLDLDGFKPINDRHGHDVGDQVLRAISIRLRSALRGADLIGRHGGDEFMLLLDDLGAGRALDVMAQRFLAIIGEPIESSAGLLSIGASLGFALFPEHGTSTDELKKAADKAMYAAKRTRAGWRLYDAALDDAVTAHDGDTPR